MCEGFQKQNETKNGSGYSGEMESLKKKSEF